MCKSDDLLRLTRTRSVLDYLKKVRDVRIKGNNSEGPNTGLAGCK